MRQTKQYLLLEEQAHSFEGFFSAEALWKKVQSKDKKIGIATVYRFLKEKVDEKTFHQYLCDRKQIYSSQKRSHCHFECEKTGKIVHFDVGSLDFLKDKIPGDITSFQLEVKGICRECE